jgi:hypothetical protein
MKPRSRLKHYVERLVVLTLILVCQPLRAQEMTPSWQRSVTEVASGKDVIACWDFAGDRPWKDVSNHGHDLKTRGRAAAANGRFGGGLESFAASGQKEEAGGALAKNAPGLSPQGAFTIGLWFQPKPDMEDQPIAFLLDKKYYHYAKDLPQANWDYCLYLQRTGPQRRQIVACLGFGTDSANFISRNVTLVPGEWHHLAFTYDAAGTGRFFFDGKPAGRTTYAGRGPIAPGTHDLALGDRYGSLYVGCAGVLDEVCLVNGITPDFAGALELDASAQRLAFVRGEPNAAVTLRLINDTSDALAQVQMESSCAERSIKHTLADIPPRGSQSWQLPVDTLLRPDTYPWKITATATAQGRIYTAETLLNIAITPRPLPHRFPVVMWGHGDLDTLQAIGFTHQLINPADYAAIWAAGQPTAAASPDRVAETATELDEYLIRGLSGIANLSPGHWLPSDPERQAKYQRIDRERKPRQQENICGQFPELQSFAFNVGASVAQTFGQFPALDAALIHTEVRDGTNLCFHEQDRAVYRAATGQEIPADVASPHGLHYTRIADFPANRVIPDNHPTLQFYRWFWKAGDGWNGLHTQVHRGLKSTGRQDLWTFFDPAARAPSVWGSGGEVDVISHWTYSYPDPIKIGQTADELFAMAEGANAQQRVMKMTQVIWYRSQTAPEIPADETQRAAWEKEIPDAPFITIAPDHLREAFWSKISRPVKGIMYHGWGSLVPAEHGGYRHTNPQTREVLTQLIRDVARPLGPTLVQLPDRPSDVAILESFASQMFAARGTGGWSHRWECDLHLILQWAHLQPRIVFDETVQRDGLDNYRVLVLPYCDVLTEPVVAAINAFQKRGGLIVADETLTPAIRADIVLASYKRTGKADEDKHALQAKTAELRQQLDPHYTRYGRASDPDTVVRFRQAGKADYLFVLNDKRTFGNYVGHHGKVMEQGLPNKSEIAVRRPSAVVYDLVNHAPVTATSDSGELKFTADLGPGDGRVYLLTDQTIQELAVDLPAQCRLGDTIALRVTVADTNGKPIAAVVPVQVEIFDPQSRPAECHGYYGAADGRLAIDMNLARNDVPGNWRVVVRELASGRQVERTLQVVLPELR